MEDEGAPRLGREAFLAVLALASILIGLARIGEDDPAPLWLKVVDVAIALAFVADWASRVRAAARPGRYALRNAWEAVTWIPFTVVPIVAGGDVLRGARLVRFVRVLRYARFAKIGLGLWRLPSRWRSVSRVARHAQIAAIGVLGLVVVALGGALLLLVERVEGYGAGLWWAFSLFTTVAYDVPAPATPTGRAVAGALMLSGVAYFGLFTASLASALLTERDRGPSEDD